LPAGPLVWLSSCKGELSMRISAVVGLVGLGLLSCHRTTTAFVNADDLTGASLKAPDSAPCNDLVQQGGDVDLAGSWDAAPSPRGGAIADGTYVLTSSTLHTKERPHNSKIVSLGKITVRVSGSTSQLVRSASDGRVHRTTVTRESDGTVAKLRTTCVSPRSGDTEPSSSTGYTATDKSFQFISPGPAGTVVATYTKL
jgi:hypothetical protein